MVLPIYIYGQPVLRKVAQDIDENYPDLKKLIADMFDTLAESNGIGLAAPQIGRDIRVVVMDLDVMKDDYPEYAGLRKVFINAHILAFDETAPTEFMDEGCLSLPGLTERVERYTRIKVRYQDEDFQVHEEWVEGFLARVMQHEFDHLEGKMFIDHLPVLRKQMIAGKLKAMLKGKFRCNYRTKVAKK